MNIDLIIAAFIVGGCGLIGSLINFFKPNHITKAVMYLVASLNLSSIFFLVQYGLGSSVYVLVIFVLFISFNFLRYGSKRVGMGKNKGSIWQSTGLLLAGFSLVFTLEIQIVKQLNFSLLMDSVVGVSFVGALMAAINIVRTIVKSRLYKTPGLGEEEAPSITVAIAARNEDDKLADCLNSVIGSDYSKMEVLVLDDCSSDGTGSLMNFYANSGVRFISGEEPPLGWIGKNWAYERLAKEAIGEYIIFLGTDVNVSPKTISRMVKFSEFYTYDMVSVQPMFLHLDFLPRLLEPFKLLWEITFRSFLKKPPVCSDMWMIKNDTLTEMEHFKHSSSVVDPEKDLAAKLSAKDGYFYAFGGADDGLSIRKSIKGLWGSALRSYYPGSGKSPAATCYLVLMILGILVVPFLGLSEALSTRELSLSVILGVVSVGIWWLAHMILTTRLSPSSWFISIFNLPIMIFVEVYLNLASMYKYEFGKVIWKGRNICWVDREKVLKLDAWRKMQINLKKDGV